ncbi:MAG: DUF1800 domain-containing protein [Opitutaceae bacterium]
MSPTPPVPAPDEAWQPLPETEWTRADARHLLLRTGFSAPPERVEAVFAAGADGAIPMIFGSPAPMPVPETLANLEADPRTRPGKDLSPVEQRQRKKELRETARDAYNNYAINWYGLATDPDRSAVEKYVLFLQNVFVVAASKVKNPVLLFQHQQLLRVSGFGSYIALTKAVSRSPAMIQYLDLQQSAKGKPNENFARELFELFTLGEGHYTEDDIKEAARAFTGYRNVQGRSVIVARQHDGGTKTVFGQPGRWSGDDVIDLVFQQPAARRFLPNELCRFYLSDEPLSEAYPEALGEAWFRDDFDCGRLLLRFFRSRLFYHPAYRGNLIKSPVQFTVGLRQDLKLDPSPLPRLAEIPMRQMGQPFFNPPNVRGWVGGQRWINASTLAARRQAVLGAFAEFDPRRLNADERRALEAAEAEGKATFRVPDNAFTELMSEKPGLIVDRLVDAFLALKPDDHTISRLTQHLANARNSKEKAIRIRQTVITLLLSPYYQVC